jgi:hypothetical protein
MKDIKINSYEGRWDLFGPETFAETWIMVHDSKGRSVQVTIDELIEEKPDDSHNYIKVAYDGQSWWIPKKYHFPM